MNALKMGQNTSNIPIARLHVDWDVYGWFLFHYRDGEKKGEKERKVGEEVGERYRRGSGGERESIKTVQLLIHVLLLRGIDRKYGAIITCTNILCYNR